MKRTSHRYSCDFRCWHFCEVPTGSGNVWVDRTYRRHHETDEFDPKADVGGLRACALAQRVELVSFCRCRGRKLDGIAAL